MVEHIRRVGVQLAESPVTTSTLHESRASTSLRQRPFLSKNEARLRSLFSIWSNFFSFCMYCQFRSRFHATFYCPWNPRLKTGKQKLPHVRCLGLCVHGFFIQFHVRQHKTNWNFLLVTFQPKLLLLDFIKTRLNCPIFAGRIFQSLAASLSVSGPQGPAFSRSADDKAIWMYCLTNCHYTIVMTLINLGLTENLPNFRPLISFLQRVVPEASHGCCKNSLGTCTSFFLCFQHKPPAADFPSFLSCKRKTTPQLQEIVLLFWKPQVSWWKVCNATWFSHVNYGITNVQMYVPFPTSFPACGMHLP